MQALGQPMRSSSFALESGAGVGVAAGFPISVSVPDSRGGCSALPNRQRRAL